MQHHYSSEFKLTVVFNAKGRGNTWSNFHCIGHHHLFDGIPINNQTVVRCPSDLKRFPWLSSRDEHLTTG
jgi:hypothetical protein